jgi:hypothetical protein
MSAEGVAQCLTTIRLSLCAPKPAKFKTRQQALNWCAAHYPDLPIKEHRSGGKPLAANKPASPGDKQ